MHGNIFEWRRDWYHLKLPGGVNPDLHQAKNSASKSEHGGVSRVRRGGCWDDEGWPCRSAFRSRFEPGCGRSAVANRKRTANRAEPDAAPDPARTIGFWEFVAHRRGQGR
jgi:formylglycine-generating enzyme required for sulfatase activity